ncbi:CopG family ribbon-helix-helix protein [Lihuaxuella thermophila]|uniref:CopG family transcriptional regulator, nickel-responsive regulator n=1 Tax=Lihuaxuella thermophila TaxID=1173111 RepID=A0A1H8JB14_9BACL|nr:ribbon-helix-helix domain-containing protein [Lihuaxuella thermophila]SEN77791.1 CopG family transcriptional regulator, nickel-responsive regulator [Lihuaxuella thermophila]
MSIFFEEDNRLKRVHIKFDKDLLALIDQYKEKKRYTNRSEAIRQLIRETLQREKFIK